MKQITENTTECTEQHIPNFSQSFCPGNDIAERLSGFAIRPNMENEQNTLDCQGDDMGLERYAIDRKGWTKSLFKGYTKLLK